MHDLVCLKRVVASDKREGLLLGVLAKIRESLFFFESVACQIERGFFYAPLANVIMRL